MSAKGIASVLAALGAGMSGFAKGKESYARGQRQKVLDAREDAEYERKQADLGKADKLEADFAASQQDLKPEAIPSYDITRMDGGNPETQPTVGYLANGQTFADQAGAQQALYGLNSRAEKEKRGAAVLRGSGNLALVDKARQMEEFAAKAIGEGTDQILAHIQAGAPQLADLDKNGGKVLGQVGEAAAEVFNATGGRWKVSKDTAVEYFKDVNPAGQPFVNARVLGKDGKPVVDDVSMANRMLLSVKERIAAAKDDANLQLDGQRLGETKRSNLATEGMTARRDADNRNEAAASRGIQMRRLALEEKSFKRQTPEGQIAEIERITETKLTKDEKKVFLGIKPGKGGKDADTLTAKIVENSVKSYQDNTPDVTPAMIATFRANLERDMDAMKGNMQVEAALKEDLGGKSPTDPGYAKAWTAAQQLGLTEKALVERGYKPPAKTVANPFQAAAGGTRAPAPAAAPARPPAAPFRPSLRTTPEQARAAAQQEAVQQQAARRQKLLMEVAQLERTVSSGEGDPTFRQQAASRLATYRRELSALAQ